MKKKRNFNDEMMSSFLELPDELILHITKYLPPKDLSRLSGTGRRLYHIIREVESKDEYFFLRLVLKHLDKDWSWRAISRNPNITMDMILKHPDKQWKWKAISTNPNLTMDMILKHHDEDWDWWAISENPFNGEK